MRMNRKKFCFGLVMMMVMFISNLSMVKAETVPVSISLENKVKIKGQAPEKQHSFTFVLEAEDERSPMPESGDTISVKGSGKASFGKILYTTPGVYHYLVYEKQEKVNNYIFDNTAFEVTVAVESEMVDGSEQLTPVIWAIRTGEDKKTELCFDNKYVSKKVPSAPPASDNPPKSSSKVVKTGDETQISLWIYILLMSFAVMSLFYKKIRQ